MSLWMTSRGGNDGTLNDLCALCLNVNILVTAIGIATSAQKDFR